MKHWFSFIVIIAAIITFFTACGQETVTVYTSVDRNYSEPFLKKFEKDTGIKVNAKYDTEASKTTGLVNTLIEEKNNPRADVFWNGEFAQTISLKEKDVLEKYKSESAKDIPDAYKDQDGYWTAFGGRARCFLVNTDLMEEADYPQSIYDFLNEKYDADKIGMAYPLFGTTATHSSAIFSHLGENEAKEFFEKLSKQNIRIVDGNSVVRDLVVDGQLIFGITDTDDAIGALEKSEHVKIIFPDQEDNQMGTLIVPNTVALIKGAPNIDNAKVFMDYILSEESEKYFVDNNWCQVTVRPIDTSMKWFNAGDVKALDVNLNDVYRNMESSSNLLKELFVK